MFQINERVLYVSFNAYLRYIRTARVEEKDNSPFRHTLAGC